MKIRIGTRRSELALWQANHVAEELKKIGVDTELVKIETKGDKILDVPLAKVGGKGLFVKEIEEAMLNKEIDIAVHSLKDVPTFFPDGLGLIAYTEREEPNDAFLSNKYSTIEQMQPGDVLGTSSLRRKAQAAALAEGLQIKDLRGNVNTRIRKMEEGQYDGIILAYSGLKRIGLKDKVKQVLTPQEMIPAVCQGTLGIEARLDDNEVIAKVREALHHEPSAICSIAERAFLKRLEGGCQVPFAGYATLEDSRLDMVGYVSDFEGNATFYDTISGPADEAESLGIRLAEKLLDAGADKVLETIEKLT